MENFKVSLLNAKEGNYAKLFLNKDDTIQFESRQNANIFKMFYFELFKSKILLIAPNKFNSTLPLKITRLIYLTIVTWISVFRVSKDLAKKLSCLRLQGRLIFGNVYVVLHYDFEWVILTILNLYLCSFNGCSLIQLKK